MISSTTPHKLAEIIRDTWPQIYRMPLNNEMYGRCEMYELTRVQINFQTLNMFLSDLQNNMNSEIPDIYARLQQNDDQDVGQSFLSNLFWSAFDLISTIETLQGKEIIAWFLSAIVQDIHDHIDQYPDLNGDIASLYERMTHTITHIKNDVISPVIDNPDAHYNDVYSYKNYTVKVSDFDAFDFVYASSGYNNALTVTTRKCKEQALRKCFPYDKWKIAFWFGESPQFSPCKQCNWGCDEWVDTRSFIEDESQPIRDYNGNILANDIWQWVTYLVKQEPSKFYVVEPVSDVNARFGSDEDGWKDQHPNGAFINEYCMVWGRDDFLNDWKDFDDNVGRWMFRDDGYGTIVNEDGFVDRKDFYRNWGLDAADCMWKPTPRPPDPNI